LSRRLLVKLDPSRRIDCRGSDNHNIWIAMILRLEPCMRHLGPLPLRPDVTLFFESLESFEIENRDASIAHAYKASRFQVPQRLVHALPWKPNEIREFFL
jgi:hypothetical protein